MMMRLFLKWLFLFVLVAAESAPLAFSQKLGEEVHLNIRQKVDSTSRADAGTYLNGYRGTIDGQEITYRSSHPDADVALLVRARKEVHSVTWETDTIPDVFLGDQYRLIWLAGLEKDGFQNPDEVHSFDLLVNGMKWCTFRNAKDSTSKQWRVRSTNGAMLSFESTMVDRAGDLFGYMTLTIPKGLVPPGKPLKLQVVGEDAGRDDWYMTFQYTFNFLPRTRLEPGVLRSRTGESQMIRVSLDNLRRGRAIQIFVENRQITSTVLSVGANVFYIPIAVVKEPKEIPIFFTVNDIRISRRLIPVKPVRSRDIYVLSYSHNDIGYTDLQPNIEKKQMRNLDVALDLIRKTRDFPPDARFKWNMEVLWAFDGYLKQASEEKRREVLEAVRNGSLGLNALYANVLTGLAGATEMSHFTEYARNFVAKHSLPITTALVSDVPGFTWGIVPTLAQSGVKFFSISPNPGDRIGYTIETWGDRPFYWKSQSGKEKILTWVARESYASFHEGDLTKLGDEKIFKLMRKLDDLDYPYDIVQLPYTIGGDNGPPDPNLSDFVKRWNDRYSVPRLIIATHEQLFTEFERRYGSTLPSFSGDFTPYWEDGAASSSFETALNRQAADRLIQAEAVWAMRSPAAFPTEDFTSAWRNVVLYDEHTWGAHNSISAPDSSFVKGQWDIKRRFATDADSLSKSLFMKAAADETKSRKGETGIDVFNTNSWFRTDVIYLSAEQSVAGDLVVDAAGNPVPSQRLSSGELAVLVKEIPSMSSRRLFVRKGGAHSNGAVSIKGNAIENSHLAVSVDSNTGVIRTLEWKRNGLQLAGRHQGEGLNEYIYVPGADPKDAKRVSNVKVSLKEKGKLVSSLLVEADAPGCRKFSCEIRVVDGINRVDIINRLDKEAIRTKEGVHFAFPFSVPQGQLRYDVAYGIVRPDDDQLPGACKNFFSVQSWVDVSNDQRGITWATPDAPLIEIGTMTAEKRWLKETDNAQNFYSYVMNNYWHTNYKADQEGMITFRYSLQPHGEFLAEEAVRFGMEQREPLIAIPATTSAKADNSLFELESYSVLAISTKPVGSEGACLLCLYNPTSVDHTTALQWKRSIPVSFHASDAFGRTGELLGSEIHVPAYGTVFVRVNRK
jgi:alpha-mannosidase